MVEVCRSIWEVMIEYTKVVGKMTNVMERAELSLTMAPYLKEFLTEMPMEKERRYGQAANFTKEIGKMISFMVKES